MVGENDAKKTRPCFFFRRNVTAASNGQPGTRLKYINSHEPKYMCETHKKKTFVCAQIFARYN